MIYFVCVIFKSLSVVIRAVESEVVGEDVRVEHVP